MYFDDGVVFDLAHPMRPKGTQRRGMLELKRQIAALTQVKHLQPSCARI